MYKISKVLKVKIKHIITKMLLFIGGALIPCAHPKNVPSMEYTACRMHKLFY
ncbi:hypothetical protein Scep_029470 [Stephania cephalantha]|uniref:Uncharacterized protein n=1 Tax=Stephania cephalantha TaxID=152367 RepID=A0AAP0DXQ4_9MAGN